MTNINGFRLVGDLTHVMAVLVLMWKIWETQSCVGISGRTQVLYAIVFISRYLDLFSNFVSVYNTCLKVFYILATLGTIGLMYKTRATYDKKNDRFRAEILIVSALLLSLAINHVYEFLEIMWTFSIYLEAVALVPQFYMTKKIGHIESISAFYIFALGSYRALYILNWVYRYYFEGFYDLIAVMGGCLQTILFSAFFCWYQYRKFATLQLSREIFISETMPRSDTNLEKAPAVEGPPEVLVVDDVFVKDTESPRS